MKVVSSRGADTDYFLYFRHFPNSMLILRINSSTSHHISIIQALLVLSTMFADKKNLREVK